MKILIACGGSGGHIFPGIALAQELAKGGNDVMIVCSRKPVDIAILEKTGCPFETLPYNPFVAGASPLKTCAFAAKFIAGTFLSARLLARYHPRCVVGFGGFVTGPVILSAWLLRIPRIIHEQNLIAGLANRVESLFANKVAVNFEETKRFFGKKKVVTVGNPIRDTFQNLDKIRSRERFGLDRDRFTLFVTGGSQGSHFLNHTVADALGLMEHKEKIGLQVIHVTGRDDYESVQKRYKRDNIKAKVFSFLDEIDRAYTASNLAIARAGATTIAELTYFGVASVLVPYPKRSVHQAENARFLSDKKAAITIEEGELNAERMKELIMKLAGDLEGLQEISGNAKRLANPRARSLLAQEVLSLSEAD